MSVIKEYFNKITASNGMFAIVDCEGSSERTSSGHTVWIKSIAVVVYDMTKSKGAMVTENHCWLLDTVDVDITPKGKATFNRAKHIHHLSWDFNKGSYNIYFVMNKLRKICKDIPVFAKGILLETALINCAGIWGDRVHNANTLDGRIKKSVFDLAAVGVPKYPHSFHYPLDECLFFGESLLSKLSKITIETLFEASKVEELKPHKVSEPSHTTVVEGGNTTDDWTQREDVKFYVTNRESSDVFDEY